MLPAPDGHPSVVTVSLINIFIPKNSFRDDYMTDKKSLEQHRRIIAELSPKGSTSGLRQAFEKAAAGQKVKNYKGNCKVCDEPLYDGFAVRCSVCKSSIFHPGCFGTHNILVHSPTSVTVIVTASGIENVWQYVDAEPDEVEEPPSKAAPEPDIVKEAVVLEVEPEEEPAVVATVEAPERATRTKKRSGPSE